MTDPCTWCDAPARPDTPPGDERACPRHAWYADLDTAMCIAGHRPGITLDERCPLPVTHVDAARDDLLAGYCTAHRSLGANVIPVTATGERASEDDVLAALARHDEAGDAIDLSGVAPSPALVNGIRLAILVIAVTVAVVWWRFW
jgi:hypothetical protein